VSLTRAVFARRASHQHRLRAWRPAGSVEQYAYQDPIAAPYRLRERPVPSAAEEQVSFAVPDEDAMDEDPLLSAQALISTVPGSTQGALTGNTAKKSDDTGDTFELSQLLFVEGRLLGTCRTRVEAPETGKGTRYVSSYLHETAASFLLLLTFL
jgi:hypothetical protein